MPFGTIKEALKYYVISLERERAEGKDNDWWYASQLGLCMRKHYYRRLGLPFSENKSARVSITALMGHAIHELSESALEKLGIVLAKEVSVQDDELRIKGRADLVLRLNDKVVVADVKTERSEAFFRRVKGTSPKVKPHQVKQLGFYYHFLKKKAFPELSEGRMLYIDRGGGCLDEFKVTFHPIFIEEILGEINALNEYWKRKEDPPLLSTGDRWQCRWCEYASACIERSKIIKIQSNLI